MSHAIPHPETRACYTISIHTCSSLVPMETKVCVHGLLLLCVLAQSTVTTFGFRPVSPTGELVAVLMEHFARAISKLEVVATFSDGPKRHSPQQRGCTSLSSSSFDLPRLHCVDSFTSHLPLGVIWEPIGNFGGNHWEPFGKVFHGSLSKGAPVCISSERGFTSHWL